MAGDADGTIKLTLDDGELVSKLQDIIKGFDNLNSATSKTSNSLDKVGESSKHTSDSHKEHADSADHLAHSYTQLGEGSDAVAAGFRAMGLEGGAAAEGLMVLGDVLRGIGEAGPAIVAIGVALAALSVSFMQLKDAISEAADTEKDMVSITALIRNQGVEGWKEQSKAVEEYAGQLAKASGLFTKGDFLKGIQTMLAYGVSLNDTLRSQGAAQDLAAAKGESLVEAEQQLAQAYDGRLMALKRLGLVTADEVKSGIPYEELLDRIEHRMSGSAADALDTYAGKQQNLANTISDLADTAGKSLLPAMDAISDAQKKAYEALKPLVDEFVKFINSNMPDIQAGIKGFSDLISTMASDAVPALFHATEHLIEDLAKLGKWFGENADTIKYFFETTIAILGVGAFITLSGAIKGAISWLAGFIAEETVASFGLNVLVAGLIAGGIALYTNWDDVMGKVSQLWSNLWITIDAVGNDILTKLADLEMAFGQFLNHIGGLGGLGDAAIQDAQGRLDAAKKTQAELAAKGQAANPIYNPDIEASGGEPGDSRFTLPSKAGSAPPKPIVTKPSTHVTPTTSTTTKGQYDHPADTADALVNEKAAVVGRTKDDANVEQVAKWVAVEKEAEHQLNLTTNATDYAAKSIQLKAEKIAIALATEKLYNIAVLEDESAQKKAVTAVTSTHTAYENALASLNNFKNGMTEESSKTNASKEELKRLEAALHDADEAHKKAVTTYNTSTTALDKHWTALDKARAAYKALKDAADEVIPDMQRKWAEFTAAQDAADAETLLTFNATNLQKISIYQNMLDALNTADVDYEKKREALDTKRRAAAIGAYEDEQKAATAAAQKIYDSQKSMLDAFLGDVAGRKSLQDTLKDITAPLQKSSMDALSTWIMGTSPDKKNQPLDNNTDALKKLTDTINSKGIGGPSTSSNTNTTGTERLWSPGGGAQITPLAVNTTQVAGSNLHLGTDATGATVASIANGTLASGSSGYGSNFAAAFPSAGTMINGIPVIGGVKAKLPGGFISGNYGVSDPASYANQYSTPDTSGYNSPQYGESGAAGSSTSLSNFMPQSQSNSVGSNPANWQGFATNIIGGASMMAQGLSSGSNGAGGGTFGQTLGGAADIGGTIAGTILSGGNPIIGAMVGQLTGALGSAIGGLFGPKLGPATQPDVYNGPATANAEGLLQGSGATLGISGQTTFDPLLSPELAQLSKAYGTNPASTTVGMLANSQSAVSQIGWIQRWVSQNQGSKDPATAALVADVQAKFGSQATDPTGTMVGGKNGNFTIPGGTASGTATAIEALAQQVLSAIGTSASSSPVFQILRNSPNFLPKVSAWGSGVNGIFTENALANAGAGKVGSLPGQRQTVVNVTVNGHIVGTGGMTELANTISTTITKNAQVNAFNSGYN